MCVAHPKINVNAKDKSGESVLLLAVMHEIVSVPDCREHYELAEEILDALLAHPLIDLSLICEHDDEKGRAVVPNGTALDRLLMSAIGVGNDTWDSTFEFEFFTNGLDFEWVISCAEKFMKHERARLERNHKKFDSIIMNLIPLPAEVVIKHVKPFCSEFTQKILSPLTIEFIVHNSREKFSTWHPAEGIDQWRVNRIQQPSGPEINRVCELMKKLKEFVDEWGQPQNFDFGDLVT